jgi:uncharacterized protein (DUF952 family)
MSTIYKIVPEAMWRAAEASGLFAGAPVDLKDGFIHFSTAAQARETAARHFAGQDGLLLAAFDADALGAALRWEVSRGGALFPHLYAALPTARALWVKPVGRSGVDGAGAGGRPSRDNPRAQPSAEISSAA